MRKITTFGLFSLFYIIFNVTHASLEGHIIGIDPGHGGSDPGATCQGLDESNIALDTALAVKEFLEADGATVVMSRTTDKNMEIAARNNLFNSEEVDYMVSVHYNSVGCVEDANGVLAYIYQNRCSAEGGELAHGIVPQVMNNTGLEDMKGAAQGELCSAMPGIFHTSYYGILRGTNMPSTLIEVSFIGNPDENKKLRDPEYLKSNGWAIYAGITDFFGEKPLPLDDGGNGNNGSDNTEKCVIIKVCPVTDKPMVKFHFE